MPTDFFYDPNKSYEENYKRGPFGSFKTAKPRSVKGGPHFSFLSQPVYLPFGIPAGPVLNSKYVAAAFNMGYDIVVYKTVRTDIYPCHPFPNILSVHFSGKNLTLHKLEKQLLGDLRYQNPISITNSFGVPSRVPDEWQRDAAKAVKAAGKGQVMIMSFMGTVRPHQTEKQFVDDYILAARLAQETGAKILEANLSCPNVGNEGLVCYNLEVTEKIARGIRKAIGNTPLVLKIGYYRDERQLRKFAEIANDYANDIAAINTLQGTIIDKKGNQALPGNNRLKSGVCGAGIKWAGLDMVKRLDALRRKKKYRFSITGVGGVTTPQDYFQYRRAGADAVMSATGAMWNPRLALDIKRLILKNDRHG